MSTYAEVKYGLQLIGYQIYGSLISQINKMDFFQDIVLSELFYGGNTWTLMKSLGRKTIWEQQKGDAFDFEKKSWK